MPRRLPLIMLPPSEGKAGGGDGEPWQPGTVIAPELDALRAAVIAALSTAMGRSEAVRSKLLGVKGTALAAAREANRAVRTAPTRPAIERYTGVLYDELGHAALPARDRRRAETQVRIFSGLWGILAPGDPIPWYKLKMGASLGRLGKLSTTWRPAITAAMAAEVGGRVVWDLLPNEHAAAWSPESLAGCGGTAGEGGPSALISVRFLDEAVRAGRRELVGVAHWNKLLKGALVRHLLATGLDEVDGLREFVHPLGYVFEPDLTVVGDDGIRTVASFVRR